MPSKFGDIYQALHDACLPGRFRRPWNFMKYPDDCRRMVDAAAVTSALLQKFKVERLIAAKVLVDTPDGARQLNPKVTADGGRMVFLRDVHGDCFDVVCARGCLSDEVPIFSMLEDCAMRDAVAASCDTVYLASSLKDLILLRSVGVSASLATDLNRLTPRGLSNLVQVMDAGPLAFGELREFSARIITEYDRQKSKERYDPTSCLQESTIASPRFSLILIAGSLHEQNCALPAMVPQICRFLTDAARYLGCDWFDFHVWRPSAEQMIELDFRIQQQTGRLIRNFVLAERSYASLEDYVDPNGPATPSPASKYYTAMSNYFTCLKNGNHLVNREDARVLHEAENAYHEAADNLIIQPLVEEAMRASRPAVRSLGIQLAQVARQLQEMMPRVGRQMIRDLENWEVDVDPSKPKRPPHKTLMELTNLSIKLVREMRRERGSGWGRDT